MNQTLMRESSMREKRSKETFCAMGGGWFSEIDSSKKQDGVNQRHNAC